MISEPCKIVELLGVLYYVILNPDATRFPKDVFERQRIR